MISTSCLWRVLVALVPLLLSPAVVFGQWNIGVEVGAERYWGGSVEAAPDHRSFRPYRPTILRLGLERGSGKFSVGLLLGYTEAGMALEGRDGIVTAKGVFTVYSAAPALSYRLATLGSGNQLVADLGPLFEAWSILDQGSRTRVGVHGGLSLRIPLGGRFAGSLAGGAAIISSPFKEGELPGYERQALWRRRFSAGLHYAL
jgi:hypothetical protein